MHLQFSKPAEATAALDQINESIGRYIDCSASELLIFDQLLRHRTIAKKQFLLRAGEICNFEGFVIKGCLRKFYIDENGHEVIIQFAVEDHWISDTASFTMQHPGKIYIEALEDTMLLTLGFQTKEKLLQLVPKFERYYRLLVERNLMVFVERVHFSINKTANEKYLDFLAHYPSLSQRVAQHHIASYLGITAEFLSRLRTKMIRK